MPKSPDPSINLNPITGAPRPISEWVSNFQLLAVVVDPTTYESSWILKTASRILYTYKGTNCRVAWVVAGTAKEAEEFLGPLADDFLTFADPERELIKNMEIVELPAFVHINHGVELLGAAHGWNPPEWNKISEGVAKSMRWKSPVIPNEEDPAPFAGSPADSKSSNIY